MRTWPVLGIVGVLGGLVGPARSEEPREVIERAVRAMGGTVDPDRRPATLIRFTFKATDGTTGGGEFLYAPGRLRKCSLKIQEGGQTHTLILVLDGDKAWVNADNRNEDVGNEEQQLIRGAEIFFSPAALPLLLHDKNVKLGFAPGEANARVDGKPVRVVSAALGAKNTLQLSFDKDSGLPVKISGQLLFTPQLEIVYSDWRDPGQGADERLLREAGLGVEGPALLAFLRKRTPDAARVAQAAALVRKLGDESFEVREKAEADLVALGALAVPHLERALKDADAEVARRAKACLETITRQNDDAVLAAAIHLIVWNKVEGGTAALLGLLPGANEATSREIKAALVALAERDGKTEPVLRKALEDKDAAVRAAAAAVLGKDDGAYLKQPGRRLYVPGQKVPAAITIRESGKEVGSLNLTAVEVFNAFEPKLFAKP